MANFSKATINNLNLLIMLIEINKGVDFSPKYLHYLTIYQHNNENED